MKADVILSDPPHGCPPPLWGALAGGAGGYRPSYAPALRDAISNFRFKDVMSLILY